MVNPLSRSQPAQDVFFFGVQFRRNEDRNRLAQNLLFRVTEDALRTGIPAGDDPVQIFRDNGVIGTLHDSGQHRTGSLRGLLLGNVHARAYVTFRYPFAAEARLTVTQAPAIFPIGTTQPIFYFEGQPRLDSGTIGIETPLTVIGMNSVGPATSNFLLQCSSRKLEPGSVEISSPTIAI